MDSHNDDTDATVSGIELGNLSRPTRRPSGGAATRPFAQFALTPLDAADDDSAAVSSAIAGTETDDAATAGMTIAERRASRSGSRSESFAFANRTIAIPPSQLATPPPDSPFDDDDERAELEAKLPAPSPVALPDSLGVATVPSIGTSVPPTPAETPTPWRVSAELESGGYFASLQAASGVTTEPATESTERLGAVDTEREIPGLAPVDGGREAQLFLLGACLAEGIVWGLPYSIGVLHEYWLSTMFKDGSAEGTLTMASTLPTAMLQFLGLPLGPLFAAMPWHERKIQFAGVAIAALSLIASAFVTKPWQLVVTFGILYPASGAVYLPFAANLFQWYHKYIGLATGAMICGTGIGGTVYPFVVTSLLAKIGYKWTMIAMGVSFALLLSPLVLLNKRRIPAPRFPTSRDHAAPRLDWGWLKHPSPWVAFACIFITSLGGFIPLLWIPSFAVAVNATKPGGTALVALMNALTIPGNLLAGHLSDRLPVRFVMGVYCLIATTACLIFWGVLGTTPGALLAFALVWAMTAGCQPATWATMIKVFARGDQNVPPLAFGIVMSLRSVGSLTSGPLSTALLKAPRMAGAIGAFGNTNYGTLISFVAAMTFGGTLTMFFFPSK
ncbi:hypothetical protein Q8F55_007312 [Vanrija albida]|uniref:Major facilitator superfamily (MFS) profile domain-containing protein n=1 Tax=Vanrija albida TaxID=181172 RepID=A0ABR3PZH7_9TREE